MQNRHCVIPENNVLCKSEQKIGHTMDRSWVDVPGEEKNQKKNYNLAASWNWHVFFCR